MCVGRRWCWHAGAGAATFWVWRSSAAHAIVAAERCVCGLVGEFWSVNYVRVYPIGNSHVGQIENYLKDIQTRRSGTKEERVNKKSLFSTKVNLQVFFLWCAHRIMDSSSMRKLLVGHNEVGQFISGAG